MTEEPETAGARRSRREGTHRGRSMLADAGRSARRASTVSGAGSRPTPGGAGAWGHGRRQMTRRSARLTWPTRTSPSSGRGGAPAW